MAVTIQDKQPELLRHHLLSIQVCVPAAWTDEQVIAFGHSVAPRGTTNGWEFRDVEGHDEKGRPADRHGDPIRQSCDQHPDFVHVVLEEKTLLCGLLTVLGALAGEMGAD